MFQKKKNQSMQVGLAQKLSKIVFFLRCATSSDFDSMY